MAAVRSIPWARGWPGRRSGGVRVRACGHRRRLARLPHGPVACARWASCDGVRCDGGGRDGPAAGDSDMRVWALASWSVVPVNSRAPARAAELLDDAVHLARRGPSPSRLGWVLALRAPVPRRLGERRQPLAALSDAYEALTEPQEERHPTDFFDLARLDAMARACLLQLGRYTDATDALSRALCARPATDRKGRSLALLELAAAHVRQDEPDEACRSAAAALTGADADVLVAPVVRRAGEAGGEDRVSARRSEHSHRAPHGGHVPVRRRRGSAGRHRPVRRPRQGVDHGRLREAPRPTPRVYGQARRRSARPPGRRGSESVGRSWQQPWQQRRRTDRRVAGR